MDVPYSIVVDTAYGKMIINRHDLNQTEALLRTGLSVDHDDITLLQSVLAAAGEGPKVFLDIGANFGTYALAMAPAVGAGGTVHAFEPQRIIYNMVAGSVALNALENVYVHNVAVGDATGQVEIPQFDYSKAMNFGSIEFGASEQGEPLDQQRGHDPARAEYVPVVAIDDYGFDRVDMMKIDVEGMEPLALDGALDTIRRCRPVIYMEAIKCDYVAQAQRLKDEGYRVFIVKINILCIPHTLAELAGRLANLGFTEI